MKFYGALRSETLTMLMPFNSFGEWTAKYRSWKNLSVIQEREKLQASSDVKENVLHQLNNAKIKIKANVIVSKFSLCNNIK